jgi:glycosyltransferase involved in cell wall biosynthesis
MLPKVSICLPNLNNKKYLKERLDTIQAQTLQNWELIVVDGFSDDGAWELFQEYAQYEPRIKLFQEPPQGIYEAFNACIRKASGEYIYIATSDDTMKPTCLEKMVDALEKNPDCSLCQCQLEFIDEESIPLPEQQQWSEIPIGQYLGEWLNIPHKRLAPHDGLLHFAVLTVYTSVTQLLIRRQVFHRIGYFKDNWSAMSDFEWEMRASLLHNTIYLPEVLASWRKHSDQATTNPYTPSNLKQLLDMAKSALNFAKEIDGEQFKYFEYQELSKFYKSVYIKVGINQQDSLISKLIFLLSCFFQYPKIALDYLGKKVRIKSKNQLLNSSIWVQDKMKKLNISESIQYSEL